MGPWLHCSLVRRWNDENDRGRYEYFNKIHDDRFVEVLIVWRSDVPDHKSIRIAKIKCIESFVSIVWNMRQGDTSSPAHRF